MKRKTYEEVKNLVESQGSTLLSESYCNNRELLSLICKCGQPFEKNLDTMNRYKKYMCNTCSDKEARRNRSIPYKTIKDKVEKCGYTLITKKENYKGTENKIEVSCPNNHTYEVFCNSFLAGKRCRKCYDMKNREKLLISYEDILSFINSIGYKLHTSKDNYIDTKGSVEVSCSENHRYRTRINTLRSGKRCRKCSAKESGLKARIPYEKMVESVEKEGYKLLTEKENYNGTHAYCMFQCNKNHKPYRSTMAEFSQGSRCPVCKESKGEKKIRQILDELEINFIQQNKFDDCKFKQVLAFDFYLPEYNLLIEYDGIQHYEIVEVFGGFDGFVDTKIRDTVKNIYCERNNIELLRIPYFKYDEIENILLNKIKLSQGDTEVSQRSKKL